MYGSEDGPGYGRSEGVDDRCRWSVLANGLVWLACTDLLPCMIDIPCWRLCMLAVRSLGFAAPAIVGILVSVGYALRIQRLMR